MLALGDAQGHKLLDAAPEDTLKGKRSRHAALSRHSTADEFLCYSSGNWRQPREYETDHLCLRERRNRGHVFAALSDVDQLGAVVVGRDAGIAVLKKGMDK